MSVLKFMRNFPEISGYNVCFFTKNWVLPISCDN